jgi:hypothetical protein
MEVFGRTVGYPLFDHKRNGEILEELKVEPVDEKHRRYKSNWLQHVTRLNIRMPKVMVNYRSDRQRPLRSPLKKQLDEAEIHLWRPNS